MAIWWSRRFDVAWYLRQLGPARERPWGLRGHVPGWILRPVLVAHYVWRGRRAGRSPHPLFEPEWYAPEPSAFARRATSSNSWRAGGVDPFARFLVRGGSRPASPHPLFDPAVWTASHPESAHHRHGPWGHFVSTARPDTPMPVPPDLAAAGPFAGAPGELGAHAPPDTADTALTWGAARAELERRLDAWLTDERRRKAPRWSPTYDLKRHRDTVLRWARVQLPDAEDERPWVSVILPVRDRAEQVRAAIRSVRAQTLTAWELIVVDDASRDATVRVVAGSAATDARMRLIAGAGRGVSAARNLGWRHARGRYIAWLDSDNTWTPEYLQTMVGYLESEGHRAAYADLEAVHGGRTRFRSLDAGPERQDTLALLEVANHIDLNVLVVRRDLLEEVGGFDEDLRRTVDYDLIWRLARLDTPQHVPMLAVRYGDDEAAPDRITNIEPKSWREVVKNKHLIDWTRLEAEVPDRPDDLVSVLVAARGGALPAWRTVASALENTDGSDAPVEVVVVDDAGSRGTALILASLGLLDERVTVTRVPRAVHRALATNLALATSRGRFVLPAEAGLQLWPGWRHALPAALTSDAGPAALIAQPLVVGPDGALVSAGCAFTGRHPLPADLLAGHPVEDARRIGDRIPIRAAAAPVALVGAGDVVRVRGLDCRYVGGWELPDLCLRLAGGLDRSQRVAVTATSAVAHRLDVPEHHDAAVTVADRWFFARAWGNPALSSDDDLWRAAGLDVTGWQAGDLGSARASADAALQIPVPAVRRIAGDGEQPPLRWAIKIAAPVGPAGDRWGDVHFAGSLAAALRELGHDVVIDRRVPYRGQAVAVPPRPTTQLDDVVLVLRGLQAHQAQPDAVNLMWVISHPELVTAEEARGFHRVFAASTGWAKRFGDEAGVQIEPLLQATDPARFNPGVPPAEPGDDVLFVGNSRMVYRPVVKHLVEAGIDVAVYGGQWEQFLPPAAIRARRLPNEEVAAHYKAAGVVLNDHWDDMREQGFVSNRLFDAAACGARVISDYVEGVHDLFGGLVRAYRTRDELVELVREGPSGFPPDGERREIAQRVCRDHSFAARARTLVDAVLALR